LESNSEIINITDNKVTAKHTLVIAKYSGQAIRVSACVDVLADKLPHPFNVHLASTACTRAEGKALRRALKIRVHTAEELANVDDDDGLHTDEAINDQQMAAIKTMCKRHDVDIVKFIKANAGKAKSLRDVKNLEGRLMINKLSTYQREGTPADVTGYDENWEEAFGG
jgi:hypothetical protein